MQEALELKRKEKICFSGLKKKNAKKIFLQETYGTDDLLSNIEKELGAKVLLCQGTQHSKGTAILYSKKLNFDLISTHKTKDGRMILVNIKKMMIEA